MNGIDSLLDPDFFQALGPFDTVFTHIEATCVLCLRSNLEAAEQTERNKCPYAWIPQE
jgi:hypothetical protein